MISTDSAPPSMSDPDTLIAAARDARRAGKSADLVPALTTATERYPGDARIWQSLGLLHRDLGKNRPAIEAFERAARLSPASARISHALARTRMEAGLPALEAFERARTLAPNDPELLISRAAALAQSGQAATAIAEFDAILAGNPHWLDGHLAYAEWQWSSGDPSAAARTLARALAAEPANAQLWYALLNFQIKVEDFAAADETLVQATAALGEAPLRIFDAVIADELGDLERAEARFAGMEAGTSIPLTVRMIRHELRMQRPEGAAALGEPLIAAEGANELLPYLSLAWRLLSDDRARWLERPEMLVTTHDLGDRIDLDALAACLRRLHVSKGEMAGQSVRGGTQTDGPLFARIDPEIAALRKLIVETVAAKIAALPQEPGHPILGQPRGAVRFAGSWSVRLQRQRGFHTSHIHPQGWFSSAFYVTVPAEEERGPRPAGWFQYGQPPANLGTELDPYGRVEPKPGRLVLFPSIMWHGTYPFDDGERMSVAFDVARPPAP